MSKKKILLIFLIIIFVVIPISYLLVYRIWPDVGVGIDQMVGPTVTGTLSGIQQAIVTNPVWLNYDIYITMAFGFLAATLIFWQGHNLYNSIRQTAARSAAKEAYGYQTVPTAQPMAIPQQPQATSPVPIIQPLPKETPPPQEQPKQ